MDNLLKEKLNRAFSEDFVGNTIFTEEELNSIFDYIRPSLLSFDNGETSVSRMYDKYFFAAVVNIVKDWSYDQDGFLDYFFKKLLNRSQSGKLYNYYTGVINRLADDGNIIFLDQAKKKYYSTVLAHAFAPISSSNAFFDLCWKVYCEDLDMNYSDYKEFFDLIARQLKIKFSYEDNDDAVFTLGHDAYDLRAGIRGIARENESLMSSYVQKTIETIHRAYNGKLELPDNYLEKLIANWWEGKKSTIDANLKRGKSYKHHVVSNYKNIQAKYIYEDGQVKIFIPPIRLRDQFSYEPYITIICGDEMVHQSELRTHGSGLIMTTLPMEFDITSAAQRQHSLDFNVEISHNGNTIYNSKQELFRDFILIKDGREITVDNALPGNYVICADDVESFNSYPSDLRKVGPFTYHARINDGESIASNQRLVLFSEGLELQDAWFAIKKKNGVKYFSNGSEYCVVEGPVKVAIKDTSSIVDFGIIYEGKTIGLHEFYINAKDVRLDQNVAYYNMSSLTDVRKPQKLAIYRFSDNRVIKSLNFISFSTVEFNFDKDIYYEADGTNISSAGVLSFDIDDYHKEIDFDVNDDEIIVPFDDGHLSFIPPILRWKIGKTEWCNYENRRGIWYENISNNGMLYLNIPSNFETQLIINTGAVIEANENGSSEYRLGEYVYSSLDRSDNLGVLLKLNNEWFPICDVVIKPKFTFSPFEKISDTEFLWDPESSYVGSEGGSFEVLLKKGPRIIKTIEMSKEQTTLQFDDIAVGTYKLETYHIGSGFLKKKTMLGSYEICIGDESTADFDGRMLFISKAMNSIFYHAREVSPFVIENLKRLEDVQGLKSYYGTLTNKLRRPGAGGKAETDRIELSVNPVKIILRDDKTCIIEGTLQDASDGSCKYGLGIDKYGCLVPASDVAMPMEYYYYEIKEI